MVAAAEEGKGEEEAYTWFFSSTRAETKAGKHKPPMVGDRSFLKYTLFAAPGDADLHKHFSNSVRG